MFLRLRPKFQSSSWFIGNWFSTVNFTVNFLVIERCLQRLKSTPAPFKPTPPKLTTIKVVRVISFFYQLITYSYTLGFFLIIDCLFFPCIYLKPTSTFSFDLITTFENVETPCVFNYFYYYGLFLKMDSIYCNNLSQSLK